MPANASTITRHLPLITPRIEFFPSKHFGAPPIITPRIDFGTTTHTPHNNDTAGYVEAETGSLDNNELKNFDTDADIVDEQSISTLITKPRGQPGRPYSGGYKLDEVLVGWSPQLIAQVTKFVKDKADQILDTNKSYCQQKCEDLNTICELVESKHQILRKYESCWPVHDMLKLYLKYTSTRSKHPSYSVASTSRKKLRSSS